MWSDFGFNIPISEGRFWLDNGIIKGFTHDGELHKLFKYRVCDDLTVNITEHKDFKSTIKSSFREDIFETWEEAYQRLASDLQIKIDESLDVIRDAVKKYSDYEFWCTTSTGKDSTVTLNLVQQVKPDIKVMFNNTSCDVADTYKIVKTHSDWIVTNPKEGIYNFFKRMNYIPTRFSRGCCSIYKEGASVEYFNNHNVDKLIQIMGIRNDESNTRSGYDFIKHNTKWSNPNWFALYPIRKWSDLDVWLYILHNNLEINSKYRNGYSRVGCAICCPYYTKSTWVLDKYWYPTLYNRWHMILQKVFLENQRWQKVNCTLSEYHSCWNGGLLRPEPTDEVIREMMNYKGITDYNVAKQYFNKTCSECGKNVRQNDVLAMNMKYHGRNVTEVKCKKCLMNELDMSKEEWSKKVEDFKNQGCNLF